MDKRIVELTELAQELGVDPRLTPALLADLEKAGFLIAQMKTGALLRGSLLLIPLGEEIRARPNMNLIAFEMISGGDLVSGSDLPAAT